MAHPPEVRHSPDGAHQSDLSCGRRRASLGNHAHRVQARASTVRACVRRGVRGCCTCATSRRVRVLRQQAPLGLRPMPGLSLTMAWRGPRAERTDRWDRDPLYIRNRATIRAQRRPCWRCGGAIAYDQPYWLMVKGRRTVNPRAFVAGHIVDRARGGTHELSNLAAECAACSIKSGAQLGQKRQRSAVGGSTRISRSW